MKSTIVFCRRAPRQRCFSDASSTVQGQLCYPRKAAFDAQCYSNIEKKANALRCQLLERHRKSYAAQEMNKNNEKREQATCENLSVGQCLTTAVAEALASHGKTAVMTQLAHSLDVRDVDTQGLMEATNKAWDAMLTKEKIRLAAVAATKKHAARLPMRNLRSASSLHSFNKHGVSLTPFDAVLQRYTAVVPRTNWPRVSSDATRAWQVNLPIINVAQSRTMQCVMAQKDRHDRHYKWQLVRAKQLPPQQEQEQQSGTGFGSVNSHFGEDKNRITNTRVKVDPTQDDERFSSFLFCRYCFYFGSNRLQRVAFLTDPVMYYVLCNLHLRHGERIIDVCEKANTLSYRYNEEIPRTMAFFKKEVKE